MAGVPTPRGFRQLMALPLAGRRRTSHRGLVFLPRPETAFRARRWCWRPPLLTASLECAAQADAKPVSPAEIHHATDAKALRSWRMFFFCLGAAVLDSARNWQGSVVHVGGTRSDCLIHSQTAGDLTVDHAPQTRCLLPTAGMPERRDQEHAGPQSTVALQHPAEIIGFVNLAAKRHARFF